MTTLDKQETHLGRLSAFYKALVQANHVTRQLYRSVLRPELFKRGTETYEHVILRARTHQHLVVFVPLARTLRAYLLASAAGRPFRRQANDYRFLLLRRLSRVFGLFRSEEVLAAYKALEFPFHDELLKDVAGLGEMEHQSLCREGMREKALSGAEVVSALSHAKIMDCQLVHTNMARLADLLSKELSAESWELLQWMAPRQVSVSRVVKAVSVRRIRA